MTTAKGLAVPLIAAALAACLFPAIAASPAAGPGPTDAKPDVPVTEVRKRILQLLEEGALYRDGIDWPAARQQLQDANGSADADSILDQLISRSTANHGRWIRASVLSRTPGARGVTRADQLQRQIAAKDTSAQNQDRNDAADPIGLISIPAFLDDAKAAPPVRYQQRQVFARQLQARLRAQDAHDRCGWIVDLRKNRGGNMWPMLAGITPLLSTDPKNREVIGGFDAGTTHQIWSIQSGQVLLDERSPVKLDFPGYVLRHPAPPVAVLLGPNTASSGEAVALAFRGRPATRSFGQETAGYSTANVPTPLPDGSILLLTGSISVDRHLKGDGQKLKPDAPVSSAEDATNAARSWLMAQPGCKAMPRRQ